MISSGSAHCLHLLRLLIPMLHTHTLFAFFDFAISCYFEDIRAGKVVQREEKCSNQSKAQHVLPFRFAFFVVAGVL